jgi:hypothetical protein
MLSALLAHPEFQQGVRDSQNYYFETYDEAPLTEEEMMWEAETNLSRHTVEIGRHYAALSGDKAPSYLEHLGWVIGTIAKGLSYTDGPVE